MLIPIYIVIQAIGLIFLGLAFIPFRNRKQFLYGFLACFVFLYLAFSSADITETECNSYTNFSREIYQYGVNYTSYHFDDYGTPANPSVNDPALFHRNTTYTGDIACEVFHYKDMNQMYFNIGLAFLALVYSIALILIQKGNA